MDQVIFFRVYAIFQFRRKKLFLLKMTGFAFWDFKTHQINKYIYIDQ
jgi:hypothetical protein